MKVGDEVYLREGGIDKGRITFSQHENGVEIYYVNFSGSTSKHEESELIPASKVGHPSASILMEIAKEAAINPEYWKEFCWVSSVTTCNYEFSCEEDILNAISVRQNHIRRKPRTIRIGNYDVPEPIEAWHHSFNANTVCIEFESEHGAIATVKALQELLGAKQ